MKKLLLFIVLIGFAASASSQLIIDFESGLVPSEVNAITLQNAGEVGDTYDGIIDNPYQISGNMSNKVAKVTLAGGVNSKAFTSLKFSFATPVDFSGSDKVISAKIYKEAAYGGVALRLLKAPGGSAGALTHDDTLTVATGVWETVQWDLAGTIADGLTSGSILLWPDAFVVDGSRDSKVVIYIDDVKVPWSLPTDIENGIMSKINAIVAGNEVIVIGVDNVDELSIYNLSGKMVAQANTTNKLNISALQSGVHILVIKVGRETKSLKFVK